MHKRPLAQLAIAQTLKLSKPAPKCEFRPHVLKSTFELVNSLAVFKACTIPALVQNSSRILKAINNVGLTTPANVVIKNTFFRHFCGGENLQEVVPTMAEFKKNHVGSILDFAMEAEDFVEKTPAQALQDAQKMVEMFKGSIDIAAHEADSFIAVKATALLPPQVLLRWTNSLNAFKKQVDTGSKLSAAEFCKLTGSPAVAAAVFNNLRKDQDGLVDWIAISEAVDAIYPFRTLLPMSTGVTSGEQELEYLCQKDLETIDLVMKEAEALCAYAREKQVKMMIDAEQTYFQPAIDGLVMHLIRKTNTETPVVFNTYQMYLKDAYGRLVADVERGERFGYAMGIKIVRGAYMQSERHRAECMSYEDPINPTLDATHLSYNKAIDFLVERVATNPKLSFVVASHNRESVERCISAMKQFGVEPSTKGPNCGNIGFAQLMGMQDGLAFKLGNQGYSVYKYIPYGPVEVTMPYLIRRAQENSTLMAGSGVALDRQELFDELKRRVTG